MSAFTIPYRTIGDHTGPYIFLNIPSEQQKYMFWFPKIMLVNSENNSEVPNDEEAKLLVKKNGNLTISSADSLHETAYYSGMENPIF